MFPFSTKTNLVMACHLTGVYDVNRSQTLPDDDYSLVKDWADSLSALQMNGIIFHNNLSDETCAEHGNEFIKFIRTELIGPYSPNVYRYFVYRDFIEENTPNIKSCFMTDISDVVAVSNPFIDELFINGQNLLFCGDEPKTLDDDWMNNHSTHLRSRIVDYAHFEENNKTATLLNCGIIGGSIGVMQSFLNQLCHLHITYNHDNQTDYTGDMGAFNYLARTQYTYRLKHGAPINTIFKAYETNRRDCWFRHK